MDFSNQGVMVAMASDVCKDNIKIFKEQYIKLESSDKSDEEKDELYKKLCINFSNKIFEDTLLKYTKQSRILQKRLKTILTEEDYLALPGMPDEYTKEYIEENGPTAGVAVAVLCFVENKKLLISDYTYINRADEKQFGLMQSVLDNYEYDKEMMEERAKHDKAAEKKALFQLRHKKK